MSAITADADLRHDTAFIGHPRGLAWLSASELWERFSYYGMQALLVLYLTKQLLLPGHVEHVLGFGGFRGAIEGIYGPQTSLALASLIFGFYAGFVYVTPIVGGIFADRFLGRTRAIVLGASLMVAGHFLMAFEAAFLVAIACLLLGIGLFKGNIATQVGELYAADDPRRADGFQIYFFGIQLAVIISPLICGTLGETVGWHWGFGAAGVGMLIGLAVYLAGRRWLPAERPARSRAEKAAQPKLTRAEWRTVLILAALIPVMAVGSIGNQQLFNSYLTWGEANLQHEFFGHTMPITWLLSLDSIVSAILIALSVAFWRWWATRWTEPNEITKLAIGTAISAVAPLTLAFAASLMATTGEKPSLIWAVAFQFLNDLGFSNVFPVGLALFSRAAPKSLGGMVIGIYYLHLFAGNLMVGRLGALLDKMPATGFWLLHAALIAGAAVVLIVIRGAAGKALAPTR
ncbi:MAG TPA: peptide MFS transporter [Alphaproteobacteria bacterium]|nr:peptide MFS transporter [Alphaproteobacteria bacterium]